MSRSVSIGGCLNGSVSDGQCADSAKDRWVGNKWGTSTVHAHADMLTVKKKLKKNPQESSISKSKK